MELYICWGTCAVPGGHPCRLAYEALEQAGHDAKVVKAYGTRLLPDFVGERVAHDASVPVLVTDEGEIVSEARSIVA